VIWPRREVRTLSGRGEGRPGRSMHSMTHGVGGEGMKVMGGSQWGKKTGTSK